MDQIDTIERLETKLKYSVKDRDQICSLSKINYYYFFFLAFSYSAQPYIVVHCSNVGKKFTYSTTIVAPFLYMVVLKITF